MYYYIQQETRRECGISHDSKKGKTSKFKLAIRNLVRFYLPYEQVVHHLNLSPLQPQNNQAPWIFPNVQTAAVTEINHKQHQNSAAESRIEPWLHYWKGGGGALTYSANPTQY